MESLPELKLPPRLVPALGKASNTDICFSIENMNRLHAQDSHHLELYSPMRTLKGKQSGQERQNLRPKFVISKVSSDSHTEVGSSSFSGVSHPQEPVDIDLMRPVHVPIGQDKVDAKGLVRSLSKNSILLDDISIQFPVLGVKPSLSVFSPAESFAKKQNVLGALSIAPPSENVENDLPHDSEETECVWDNSLPSSGDASPNSNIYSGDVLMEMSTNSCKYQNDEIFINGMLSIDRDYEITKGSNIGDSLESAETSLSRASYSSGLSDDSNWSSIVSSANKPHKGNDPRWNAILGIRARERSLGMSHFRLLKRLGCGDIGTVYLSELSGTPCYFALKVMDKASLASRNKLTRAQTEREILQLLDHPFLPTLYSYFETDQFSCLVMEYCPGGDLHSLRQRQPGKHFPEYAARFYAAEVLLAIEYLHMLGVVYRDLKPENVLVRDDGHIMLSDFDLSLRCMVSPTLIKNSSFGCDSSKRGTECIEPTSACVQPSCFFPQIFIKKNSKNTKKTQDSRMSAQKLPELVVEPTAARSMSFVGTHEYLAPEIIKGEGHGSAVDWWTFGIFLHELLFGKTPFKGSGNRATMFNVVGQQLKLPVSPATSSASRDLIRSLLVKEPQDRLGVKRGAAEIKQHPFFERVNWALIRCSTPPTVPRPVEAERPTKFQPPEPVGVCSSGMVGMDMNSGGKFLDFEFF